MRELKGFVLAIVLAFSVPAMVGAQTEAPDTRPQAAPVEDRADYGSWGWLGLLGLAGLLGLKRRDTVDVRDRVSATAHR